MNEPSVVRALPIRLMVVAVLEPVIRVAAWLAGLGGSRQEGLELRLRGLILGWSLGLRIGRNVRLIGSGARLRLGQNVTLYGNTVLNWGGREGRLEIGAGTHVDHFCALYGQGGLHVGANCALAAGCLVYSQTNADTAGGHTPVALQPTLYRPVSIGDGCWLGAGVKVLPGAQVGPGAHIGAGAVVIDEIPANTVAVGIPARVIKERQA